MPVDCVAAASELAQRLGGIVQVFRGGRLGVREPEFVERDLERDLRRNNDRRDG